MLERAGGGGGRGEPLGLTKGLRSVYSSMVLFLFGRLEDCEVGGSSIGRVVADPDVEVRC